MTARHQSSIYDVSHPHFQQRLDAEPARKVRQGPRWMPRVRQAIIILVLFGVVMFLRTQPVAAAVSITEYKVSSPGVPQGIAAGSDGALWFTEFYDNQVGRITTQGSITLHTLNTLNSATYITAGPDGALWFTLLNDVGGSTTNKIGRITTAGAVTMYTVPKASYIWDITTGPDGNLYFTDGASAAWRVTTKGHFTRFAFNDSTGGYPYQITKGPDGNLWFTDRSHLIVKMTTSGKFTSYTLAASDGTTDDITAGPDGNLWFTLDGAGKIGRITPSGSIAEFPLANPNHDSIFLSGITRGPDGNLWFTYEDYNTLSSQIGRITTSGAISLWPTPTADSGPTDITAGSDGALWFTEAVGKIGRITTS
jgi:streptogramin lyase